MGHAEEDGIAHRFGRVGRRTFEQGCEFGDCGFQFSAFEEGEGEIETQTGHAGFEREGFAVERNCFLEVILPRFEQAEVRVGLGIGGVSLEEGAPGLFALGEFALLLEGEGGLTEVRRWRLREGGGGGEEESQGQLRLQGEFHRFPFLLI